MSRWISRLLDSGELPTEGYRELLMGGSDDLLREAAERETMRQFGRGIYVRALIEVTNYCRNSCYYCGIQAANREVERYALSSDTILAACDEAYRLGFRTFVMQGGESPHMSDEWVEGVVREIKSRYSDCAVTLSLGEWSEDSYLKWFEAGASRYLLRHETFNRDHYSQLHPSSMSYEKRHRALRALRAIGYQVGTGMMVGSPFQSIDHLVEDLKFIESFRPEMVGIGPFIPHHVTRFAEFEAGSVEMTLRLISIVRLMNPKALIPSTTALATLSRDAQMQALVAGANVVMPNVTPQALRGRYALYDNKAAFGSESAEGLKILSDRVLSVGREINFERGDYKA